MATPHAQELLQNKDLQAPAHGLNAYADSAAGGRTATSPSRTDAYLAATAQELRGSGMSVEQIRREMVIDGYEVYALEGPSARCILVAGTDQPAGKSESLGCQPSEETNALGSGFARPGGQGAVDLVWTGQSAAAVSAQAGGQDLASESGPTIVAVTRPDANAAGKVTWTAAGEARSFSLVSAQELDVRRRAARTSAAAGR